MRMAWVAAAIAAAAMLGQTAGAAPPAKPAPSPAAKAPAKSPGKPAAKTTPAAADLSKLKLDIPATKFVLKNGLTLIVSEDHKAPIVSFVVWYHVGSKNEPRGRSGFAHLFEHLMFQGSEHFNDDFFKATQKLGATNQNGTTSEDRTNYFQDVPKEELDNILWLESDRMGHLLGAVNQARLDEQRGVVQNEKRQGENQPYGQAFNLITKATYPEEHPYGHTVIGSMEDLDAATLDQVKDWFRTYYGPSNAVVVLAGDITPAEAKAKVEKYFGDIPPGPPVAHPKVWIAKRTGAQREIAYDRVAQPRLYKVWNTPEYGSRDADLLEVFGDVLSGDVASRLDKRLVHDEQIATSISVFPQ
ncbi:MAG TPA: pitrilysin family protein, partial [Caulobacteraceae bacterium]|nr:pitrilysin family protein [Caulobacteraceae bacterium]